MDLCRRKKEQKLDAVEFCVLISQQFSILIIYLLCFLSQKICICCHLCFAQNDEGKDRQNAHPNCNQKQDIS
jgi:hypothetical protein